MGDYTLILVVLSFWTGGAIETKTVDGLTQEQCVAGVREANEIGFLRGYCIGPGGFSFNDRDAKREQPE